MTFKLKIFITLILIFAILAVVFTLLRDSQNPRVPTQDQPEPVVEVLTDEQKKSIAEFVQNFLLLYNTYAYEDYSNLTALGDYQTQNAQKQTLERVEKLSRETPIGLTRSAELRASDILEIKSLIVPPEKIQVTAQFLVKEQIRNFSQITPRSDESEPEKAFQIKATLKLVAYNQGWLVDDISILEN